MKANELMIGDWVQQIVVGEQRFNHPIKVGMRELIRIQSALSNSDDGLIVEPIPLTAEILEKNGYTQSLLPKGYVYKFEDDRVMTLERFADYWVVRIYGNQIPMECRSVHELQHALRLCGVDKEITI